MFCNDVVLRGNRICPREGSGRMVSTCADGFHFIGGRRGPHIENNFFDRLVDDNIVISLRGNRIQSVRGDQLELQGASVTWYEVGDTIEVVEVGESRRTEYKIIDMQPQKNFWLPPVMTLDRPIEGKIVPVGSGDSGVLPTVVFNKSWRQEGTVIRNNVFQNTRRYAVFMGAGGVTIENNAMSNHTSAAILCSYIEMLNNKPNNLIYYFSSDIMIRNNTIVNALNFGEGGRVFDRIHGAMEIYDFDRDMIGASQLRLPRKISIRNNLIVNSGAAGISIANASDVTLSGNAILFPNRQAQKTGYGISLFASDVNLSNNVFQGPRIDEDVHQAP
jgi:parallel beta-helix repeat protein